MYSILLHTFLNRATPEWKIFWVFPANPGVQKIFTVKIAFFIIVNMSNMWVTLNVNAP